MLQHDCSISGRRLPHLKQSSNWQKYVSLANEVQLEKDFALHMEQVHRVFRDKTVDENDIRNVGETNFVIDMDNGTT